MRRGFRAPFATAFAIGFGLLVLAGILIPELADLRNRILNWAVLLAAIALLLGLFNLFQVHFDKMRNKEQPLYSGVLIVAMLATFAITVWEGSGGFFPTWLFNNIQVPVETSLLAVLAVTLTIAATRLFRERSGLMNTVFIITVFILLIGSGPLFGLELPYFTRTLGPFINNYLSMGAARGLLIGVGLGTLATGIRILIGADRPYGG
jgi:hypothetical protein